MVRSPHAHALTASIDTGRAEGMAGVIAVLTGSDAERDGLQAFGFYTAAPNFRRRSNFPVPGSEREGPESARRYWAAAAIVRAAATGRWARRKVRIWRTASGILSGVSFHG